MSATSRPVILLTGLLCLAGSADTVRAEGVPEEYRATVARGLDWLVKNQHKDGHWEALGSQYPFSMTAVAGVALLMEGSTPREGKYKDNIRKAADWLMARSMPNGMLSNPNIPGESGRYMYGHGYSLIFLSCVYGEEEDVERRKNLEDILTRAVQFSREAQARSVSRKDKKTPLGGWGYVSAKDGNNFTENAVSFVQLLSLRAARDAGIKVPPEAIKEAVALFEESTNAQGGVIYSLAAGGGGEGRPAITVAAITCAFSAREFDSPLVKKWLKFSQENIPAFSGNNRFGFDEYTHYYYARAIYMLGDDGYAKLFPNTKEADTLTWSRYRKATFDNLVRMQQPDGSWTGGHVGPVFTTALHLGMMQLDNAALPLFQRGK
jgi:Prenyltransferase and squalene oxidase repeat